ncbi:methylamine dehydrogenase accessory protein MauD [Prosthecomicrobium hirschii]|uniref:methylamine dehydrogenase accessory protein MauD n=1 Tax=Prosthecodimorpha hirschii TaxID=665126 RepID=UPI00112E5D18|nr:methylamine dehydrogenase accessory protein MauD [Prosthecomicrobium hirschii]MCW1840831.1 methylamine dehydrogenase accessory protein MauD [Prosthecomicrobium hirschii]TPQ49460.1 methylamine dehydrogenase accessory protein MauD [Prosthecomicrobium hirschii]
MEGLVVAVGLLWVLVVILAVVVFALARQVGVLFERVAPMGALMTDAGPKIGEAAPRMDLVTLAGKRLALGGPSPRSTLVFFLSPTCPVCKKLLPVLKSARTAEAAWMDVVLASDGDRPAHDVFVREKGLESFPYILSTELGMTFRVSRLPFAILIDGAGVVRAKGLINNREQLESLFNAKELAVPSIQDYLDRPAVS